MKRLYRIGKGKKSIIYHVHTMQYSKGNRILEKAFQHNNAPNKLYITYAKTTANSDV